jgi:predicted ATPase
MGYPEQAEMVHRDAWKIIDELKIEACNTFALGYTLTYKYLIGDVAGVAEIADRAYARSVEEGYLFWASQARVYRGWAQAMNGDPEAGIADMEAALESYRLTGSGLLTPQWRLMMAQGQLRAGRAHEALETLESGIRHALQFEEHALEPELHRLKGEVAWMLGDAAAGEASLRRAIEVAQDQTAKIPELRSTISLAKLLRGRDRIAEARGLLQPLYDWFQEGFKTVELREARALLESMGAGSGPHLIQASQGTAASAD